MRTELEKMLALCQVLNATPERHQDARRELRRELLGKGRDTVWMQPPFYCDDGSNILLGERVFFNFNIYTATHPMDARLRREKEFGKRVEIGSDVWVGGGAVILPGARIGSRAVIGAGSVVTASVPDDVFAAGTPVA